MKQILLFLMVLSLHAAAQKPDCKFIKMRSADGTTFDAVQATAKLGNIYVGKVNGKLVITYITKGVFDLIKPDNPAYLKLDSIKLMLTGNKYLLLRVTWGYGIVSNTTTELQPTMTNAQFTVALDLTAPDAQLLFNGTITGFAAFGDKDSRYGDELTEKQQAKLAKAFSCNQ